MSSRANGEVIGVILAHIDANPEALRDVGQRRPYLRQVVANGQYAYVAKGGKQKNRDENTLHKVLSGIIRTHPRKGANGQAMNKGMNDLFTEGSAALDMGYLQSVGYATSTALAGPPSRSKDKTSTRKRSASLLDDDVVADAYKPSEKKRKVAPETQGTKRKRVVDGVDEALDLSGSEEGLGRKKRKAVLDTEAAKRKRAAEQDQDQDDPSEDDARSRKRSKVRQTAPQNAASSRPLSSPRSSAPPDHVNDDLTAEAEAHHTSIPSFPRPTINGMQPLVLETAPTKSTLSPLRNPARGNPFNRPFRQENHEQSAASESDEAHDRRQWETWKTTIISDKAVSEAMAGIYRGIHLTISILLTNLNWEPAQSANLVQKPVNELAELYFEIFSSWQWKDEAIRLQSANKLDIMSFLESLVSSFVTTKVLFGEGSGLPWETPCRTLNEENSMDPLQKYLGPIMDKRGFLLDRLLREAAMAQINDEKFQEETLTPKAHELAADLCLTINSQLESMRGDPASRTWHEDIVKGFRDVCKQALILRGKLYASQDRYTVIGFAPGEAYDRQQMDDIDHNHKGEVAITVFQGLRRYPADAHLRPETVACEALVLLLDRGD